MLNRKFYIQHTVDVYLSDLNDGRVRVIFRKMTTRDTVEILVSKSIENILISFDGRKTVRDILNNLGCFNESEAIKFISFLLEQHLITEENYNTDERYARQISYFSDFVLDKSGTLSQELLSAKKIVVLGCGAVNSAIVEMLVRAGVLNFTLVDYKKVTASNLDRETYLRDKDIGLYKVDVLTDYLKRINSEVRIKTIKERLMPHTDLSNWIDNDTNDLVINGCDEPYIGYTSVKVGRYLQEKNIPLFVSGGFDAHSMSSGELIFPPKTPCIDCVQKTFGLAVKDWNPTYTSTIELNEIIDAPYPTVKLGGSAGIGIMAYFSANFAVLRIIHFLLDDKNFDYTTKRYEYLPNLGILTDLQLNRQDGCNVCSIK